MILVEFEHVPGALFGNDYQSRRHIHTVARTSNAGDYGVDPLRPHHERHHRHGHPHHRAAPPGQRA